MRLALLGALALALVPLAPAANATDYCHHGPLVDIAGTAYVTVDAILAHGYLYSVRVFLEDNGVPGLQRGGSGVMLGWDDVCPGPVRGDMVVF